MSYFVRNVDDSSLQTLERRLQQTMDMVVMKKKRIAVSKKDQYHGNQGECGRGGWFGWARLQLKRNSIDPSVNEETQALEEFSRQLFLESVDLHNEQERQRDLKTLKGKYFNILGHFFSIYCLWKISIATVNILFDRVGRVDPVTRGIEIAVNYLGFQFDVRFWSQHISFWLVGIITITSIRGLLITLTKFFYAIASSKSSNIIVLCLAQVMGMYFISCVLLMRMNLPSEYRSIITEVLGDLQFNFYHRWFDVIFLISALSSIAFLYTLHKQSPLEDINKYP